MHPEGPQTANRDRGQVRVHGMTPAVVPADLLADRESGRTSPALAYQRGDEAIRPKFEPIGINQSPSTVLCRPRSW